MFGSRADAVDAALDEQLKVRNVGGNPCRIYVQRRDGKFCVEVGTMIRQCKAMLGTKDLTDWEKRFFEKLDPDMDTRALSEKQLEVIDEVWSKHFA